MLVCRLLMVKIIYSVTKIHQNSITSICEWTQQVTLGLSNVSQRKSGHQLGYAYVENSFANLNTDGNVITFYFIGIGDEDQANKAYQIPYNSYEYEYEYEYKYKYEYELY